MKTNNDNNNVKFTNGSGRSTVTAASVLVCVALLFGAHQEVLAKDAPYDEYYFLLRSTSFDLMGSRLAPIKEYLYSLFIRVSRIFGFDLRNFEVICYGLALTCLWTQVRELTRSTITAWMAVLPLALFTYQSPVFNLTTYDSLQLILTPLTFASSIMIFNRRGQPLAVVFAGLIAGLQVLTRPEGVLFLAAPTVALILVALGASERQPTKARLPLMVGRIALLVVIPIVFQQGMSAVNQVRFGFWAPTIMKSRDFTDALRALMSIRPVGDNGGRYAPVPMSAMDLAFEVSPAFRRAEGYFSPNLGGSGWSAWAPKGYETHDGSIDGGHFEWALLEASAQVAGPKASDMLAYLRTVSNQLGAAFEDGRLRKRVVISPALGPNFSIDSRYYWGSAWKITKLLTGYGEAVLPQVAYASPNQIVERDFDRLALRRTALIQSDRVELVGWMVNPSKGLPTRISLNQRALAAGVTLRLIERPDVAGIVSGLDKTEAAHPLIGFELSVPRSSLDNMGDVEVEYGSDVSHVPLVKLANTAQGTGFHLDGVRVQMDQVIVPPNLSQAGVFEGAWWVAFAAHFVMRAIFLAAILAFALALLFRWVRHKQLVCSLVLVSLIAGSILIPRLALLSAIDAFMFPGIQPRYLAVSAFSLWFFAWFVVAELGRQAGVAVAARLKT